MNVVKAMELCGSQGGDTGEYDVMIGDCGEIKGTGAQSDSSQQVSLMHQCFCVNWIQLDSMLMNMCAIQKSLIILYYFHRRHSCSSWWLCNQRVPNFQLWGIYELRNSPA